MTEPFLVVLSTASSQEEGERIAEALVTEALAACVNVLGGCRSVYRWEGEVVRDDEVLLVIKTSRRRFDDLAARIAELHSYEVPEVVGIAAAGISESYRKFLSDILEA